jgi:hypothetical protein
VPGEGGGGVLLASGATATLRHCTVAFNTAASDGGGMLHAAGTVATDLSIFAENLAPLGPDVSGDCGSLGFNLVQQSTGCVGLLVTDLSDVDARLEPLADNGGVTLTHALGNYSRAIDAAVLPCSVATDQRGNVRPIAGVTGGDPLCDLGALEAGTVTPPCPADLDDGSNTNYPDAGVDINDLLFFLAHFEIGDVAVDLDNGTLTGTQDGGVDISDLLFFLYHFDLGC